MAIRVLAMIPDISPAAAEAVARPRTTASPKRGSKKRPGAGGRSRNGRAPRRSRRRSAFPTSSIVALAVIAAVIWSYVAIREIRGPDAPQAEQRVAADVESAGQGTTLR